MSYVRRASIYCDGCGKESPRVREDRWESLSRTTRRVAGKAGFVRRQRRGRWVDFCRACKRGPLPGGPIGKERV